jgi:hypothetical protein
VKKPFGIAGAAVVAFVALTAGATQAHAATPPSRPSENGGMVLDLACSASAGDTAPALSSYSQLILLSYGCGVGTMPPDF